MEQEGKSLLEFAEAVFRSRWMVLMIGGSILLACVLYALLAKPEYGSTMKVMVQNTRSNTTVGAQSGQATSGALSADEKESQINSQVELLQSNDMLEGLVRYRDETLHGIPFPGEGSLEMAQQTRDVKRRIVVAPIRKSDLIVVNFVDTDPVSAQKSLQWLSTQFLYKNAALRRPAQTYEFFEKQTKQAEGQLHDAELALIAFDRANGITSLDQEQSLVLQKLSDSSKDAESAKAALRGDQARLDDLHRQESTVASRVKTQVKVASNAGSAQQLDTLFTELQNRRLQLLNRFQPGDILVKEVDEQIAATQASMSRIAAKQSAETTEDENPVYTHIQEGLQQTSADVRSGEARLTSITRSARDYSNRLNQLQKFSVEHNVLDRRVQELRQNLKIFSEKRDDAQIDDELDRNRIVDVAIAEEPTISSQPVRPHRLTTIALGFILGCFMALGYVLVKEVTRQTFYYPSELEAALSCPVLATLPNRPLKDLPVRLIGAQPEIQEAEVSSRA